MRFTEQEQNEIIKMYQNGATKKDIAREYGTSSRTVKKVLSMHGEDRGAIRYEQVCKEKAMEMAYDGFSCIEISEETGLSLKLAKEYIKRVEKEIEKIEDDSNLTRAVSLCCIRKVVVNGTSYTDITDFIAGV